jgi:hypothetical protein
VDTSYCRTYKACSTTRTVTVKNDVYVCVQRWMDNAAVVAFHSLTHSTCSI